MKILAVDDDEISLSVHSAALRAEGYEVVTARNGREALEVIRREHCRLVVCDWEMPEMDGLQVCRALRGGEFEDYIYIILLTSHDRLKDVVTGLTAGADDYITKPFHTAELMARIRSGERVLAIEARELVIFLLAKLSEARDHDTGAHLERVRSYARLLALELKRNPRCRGEIDEDFVRLIFLTSPLHDIGKVAIPDSVLLKPGTLDQSEFQIMKTHAALGAQTLQAAIQKYPDTSFLRMAHDIALCHHERFDGGGYPKGLTGRSIPLSARIVALADVYDALTSRRVYRDAFTHETADAMILAEDGRQFDPMVVKAYKTIRHHFPEIRKNMP